jgi:hypothetical protein
MQHRQTEKLIVIKAKMTRNTKIEKLSDSRIQMLKIYFFFGVNILFHSPRRRHVKPADLLEKQIQMK